MPFYQTNPFARSLRLLEIPRSFLPLATRYHDSSTSAFCITMAEISPFSFIDWRVLHWWPSFLHSYAFSSRSPCAKAENLRGWTRAPAAALVLTAAHACISCLAEQAVLNLPGGYGLAYPTLVCSDAWHNLLASACAQLLYTANSVFDALLICRADFIKLDSTASPQWWSKRQDKLRGVADYVRSALKLLYVVV